MTDITTRTRLEPESVVLVVDDVPLVREVLRAGLRCHGFEVRLAASGREAVELYRREHEAIALVLLDVHMPGPNGPAVLTALRTIEPNVRAFFMTGDPSLYGEDQLWAAGARCVFAKPLNINIVVDELRRSLSCMDERETTAALPAF